MAALIKRIRLYHFRFKLKIPTIIVMLTNGDAMDTYAAFEIMRLLLQLAEEA